MLQVEGLSQQALQRRLTCEVGDRDEELQLNGIFHIFITDKSNILLANTYRISELDLAKQRYTLYCSNLT